VDTSFLGRLATRTGQVGSVLCLGIDPDPETIPSGLGAGLAGLERFCQLLLSSAGPHAAAVKANVAFFEAFGSAGLAVLERVRTTVPNGLPFILDAKRGDIGSTSARYAVAAFDALHADALTVSPYLGPDAITPLLERPDRMVYLLCRTSNPGAATLQGLRVAADAAGGLPEETLALRVARLAGTWQVHPGTVGLVVGATAPADLAAIRTVAPGLPFLVPGVGAQGGAVDAPLTHGPATAPPTAGRPGGGLLVNVSRGIAAAAAGAADVESALADAARSWNRRLAVLG
jgi:orotidine 5'-phosphate decarboxylase subfamily 2